MKLNKYFKLILFMLILIMLFLVIRSTYSKYISTKESGTNLHISKWNILLNNKNISENQDFSGDIKIVYDKNTENIAENVIVPTIEGHFEIILESTGTELPFEYTINLDSSHLSTNSIPDFKIISYTLNSEKPIDILAGQTEITGIVEPPKDVNGNFTGEEVLNRFNFLVKWIDDEKNVLDNQGDVSASKDASIFGIIPMKVQVKQIQI